MAWKIHKRTIWIALWVATLIVLAACTAPAAPTTSGEATDSTAPAGEMPADAAAEQTIRYVGRNFAHLAPATEGGFARAVISHIWMPFFIRDYDGAVHPWLASGYDVSEDGLIYTIHIDDGAVWSDGTPVTAEEAKVYWEYALSPECVSCRLTRYSAMKLIDGAQAVIDGTASEIPGLVVIDDKTLEIHLTSPKPLLIDTLAHYNSAIVKMEDVLKGENWSADGSARVNGPFMVEKWDIDTKEFEVVQNPGWWGEQKPLIERISISEATDENVSFIMWQNDEVDIAQWLSNIREPLRATEPESFYLIPYATNFFFLMFSQLEPFDDINLRRALVHSVDWSAAINAAWEGARNDRLMTSHLTPELTCYKENNWPDFGYDPELAKEEFAASKYGNGAVVPKIRITTNGQAANHIRTAEIMVEQWKNVLGITDVEIRPGTIDAWGQEVDLVQLRRASAGATIPDDAEFLLDMYGRYSTPEEGGLVDPLLAGMVEELASANATDPDYCEKVQAFEAQMLSNYYLLPMVWDLYEYNAKSWVKNFDVNVDNNWIGLLDMYVAER
jgi:oligopeptide transport system substrate-binding protein